MNKEPGATGSLGIADTCCATADTSGAEVQRQEIGICMGHCSRQPHAESGTFSALGVLRLPLGVEHHHGTQFLVVLAPLSQDVGVFPDACIDLADTARLRLTAVLDNIPQAWYLPRSGYQPGVDAHDHRSILAGVVAAVDVEGHAMNCARDPSSAALKTKSLFGIYLAVVQHQIYLKRRRRVVNWCRDSLLAAGGAVHRKGCPP